MIFNSLTFLVFLLFFLILWQWARWKNWSRLYLILIFSIIFYGWWDWRFLFLILFTGCVDFFLALGMEKAAAIKDSLLRQTVRKSCVILSIVAGIGVLSVFKYSRFFAECITKAAALINVHISPMEYIPEFCLILPVGISFYTFQSLSYTIDVYRGKLSPTRSFVHYMSYLMLFPQLVAGPIVRAVDLLPKLLLPPADSRTIRYNALKMIALGFFKKCVLADSAAVIVDKAFAAPQMFNGSLTWITVMVLFSIQIYCDFSGYSDIARGIIKYMGYRFDLNFNHPYVARGLHDFWSRWHISLSSWFKDYLYIPLGGNKKGKFRTCCNLFITFLISGLWHGAAMNFIIWGAYHGVLQIAERVFNLKKFVQGRVLTFFFIILTQAEVLIGWVFFRSASLPESLYVLQRMFAFSPENSRMKYSEPLAIIITFIIMEFILIRKADQKLLRNTVWFRYAEPFAVGALMICTILFRGEGHGFIYFQF